VRRALPVLLVLVLVPLAFASAANATRTLYVGGVFGDGIASLSIAANGALSPTVGSPNGTLETDGVALTPDGAHLFATSAGTQTILTYDVNADGSLSATGGLLLSGPPDPDPTEIAISPDGKHAYIADPGPEGVRVFTIAENGSLTPVETALMPEANNTSGVAITPDGRLLFASATNPPTRIYGFAVGLTGSLTPLIPPFTSAVAGAQALSIAPNGNTLYVASTGTAGIQAFATENNELAQIKGSPVANGVAHPGVAVSPRGDYVYASRTGAPGAIESFAVGDIGQLTSVAAPFAAVDETAGIAVTPDGTRVYSAGDVTDGGVSAFTSTAGALSLVAPTPFPSNVGLPIFSSLAISPNQPPKASFTSTQQGKSNAVRLDAGGSTDSDGTIVRYDWDFGDGTRLANGGPAPLHTYPGPGTYSATLTLTDEEGCSTTFVSTGQTASCNGSAAAVAERPVAVVDSPPKLLLFGPKRERLDGAIELRASCDEPCTVTARAKLVLSIPGARASAIKRLKVLSVTRGIPTGKRTQLKLKLPAKTLQAAQAGGAAGSKARIKIVATAVDSSGQRSAKATRTIRLTLPAR
jgi:DNA-binding beta-propeller fold protein YncE